MLLQQLKDFNWLNEPQAVFFLDNGMKVISYPETSFWQNSRRQINRDNGHFFNTKKDSDFTLTVKWDFTTRPADAEAGLMLRIDAKHWVKCGSIWTNDGKNKIIASVTNSGFSDYNDSDVNFQDKNIWFKAKKEGDLYTISYSKDGNSFILLRKFYFHVDSKDVYVGAYLCNPNKNDFEAILNKIEFI